MNSVQKINEFISKTKAFENMPKEILTKTKNHMLKDGWKIYRFNARVKNDDGYEADLNFMTGDIHASYCWHGEDEYCITTPEFFDSMVSKTYKSQGVIVFEL